MQEIDLKSISTIRMLAVDGVEKANSGHPGLPMGAAPMAYALWKGFYTHNPKNPDWLNRDRFVLSAGHGSMLQYALLHLSGYDVSLEDLKQFRQWGSKTPGHPEYGHTPGVELTTGPLGQGFATGVGMAMAEKFLAQTYNTDEYAVVDYHTYGIVSDGDLMEGVASEAASIAGNLSLGKLIYLYDSNSISIEGSTDLAFCENVGKRFEAYHWQVIHVEDGNDAQAVTQALEEAKNDERPSLIISKTHIGYGSPKADTSGAHGSPLGEEARSETREFYSWPDEDFFVPEDVAEHMLGAVERGNTSEQEWNKMFAAYQTAEPKKAAEFLKLSSGELPDGWDADLPVFSHEGDAIATRSSSGKVMQVLADTIPTFMGGSADLNSSNKTELKDKGEWTCTNHEELGRNMHYGVREHGMAAITNGLALSKAVVPFAATFFMFSDYARGAIRLSALMGVRAIYVFTHDSIAQGEDGATHQPIEHLASFRALPNMHVLRPADANEVVYAWKHAVSRTDGPTMLILSRQNLPILNREVYAPAQMAEKGAYILNPEVTNPEAILIATGSEVHLAIAAMEQMKEDGIAVRVVSMPSWEVFAEQSTEYRDEVLPPSITKRVAVEAGSRFGWERHVGQYGGFVTVDSFGASAPGGVMMEKFGFTIENIVNVTKEQIAQN